MSSTRQFQVTFDCAEPERLARFWCEALGYVVPPPPEGFAAWEDSRSARPAERRDAWFACVDPSGVGPRLYVQRVPEGKAAKNRLHLDVRLGPDASAEQVPRTHDGSCESERMEGCQHGPGVVQQKWA
ncbi:VOC family protein [Kitasatospora sp. NPDC005856]|uniref:VOC family protein n=1 Tax=Kitasatospora sp. NPDC005856 TaxID=3154566 RepID=UPI0033CCDB27